MSQDSVFDKLLRIPTRAQYFQELCSMAKAELALTPCCSPSEMSRTLYFRRRYEQWREKHNEDCDFRPMVQVLLRSESVCADLGKIFFGHGVPTMDQVGVTFDLLFQTACFHHKLPTFKSTAIQSELTAVAN